MASTISGTFQRDQQVSINVTFTDVPSGELVDPTTVTLYTNREGLTGDTVSYVYGVDSEISRNSTGSYTGRIQFQYAGRYFVTFKGTWDGNSASQDYEIVIEDHAIYLDA